MPLAIRSGSTRLTVLIGTAKPTPPETPVSEFIAVLMPITRPWPSRSGPPSCHS